MQAYDLALREFERRLSNMVRIGTVSDVDFDKARVRVSMGGVSMGWMPFMTSRAGNNGTSWHAPAEGEQVLVLCREGEPAMGVVLGSVYGGSFPASSSDEKRNLMVMPGGWAIERKVGEGQEEFSEKSWQVKLPEDGVFKAVVGGAELALTNSNFEVKIGGTAFAITDGKVSITGANLTVDGDVSSSGISFKNHVHGEVQKGEDDTGTAKAGGGSE